MRANFIAHRKNFLTKPWRQIKLVKRKSSTVALSENGNCRRKRKGNGAARGAKEKQKALDQRCRCMPQSSLTTAKLNINRQPREYFNCIKCASLSVKMWSNWTWNSNCFSASDERKLYSIVRQDESEKTNFHNCTRIHVNCARKTNFVSFPSISCWFRPIAGWTSHSGVLPM